MGVKEESNAKQNGSDGKGKVRGVPSSFGYVKRSTSGTSGNNKSEARTAQVSAVPRTKVSFSFFLKLNMIFRRTNFNYSFIFF